MYCIYRITNKLNGKTYIGKHKYKDLSEDTYMGSGKYLRRSMKEYGIENFEREILISEIETRDEINQLEKEYIKLERESGHGEYNISRGGDGGWFLPGINHPNYGKHLSEGTKLKMSESHKGKSLSEDTRNKMSESRKGVGNSFYGKRHSENTREKMSESHKRENLSEETRKRRSEAMSGKRYYTNGIECHMYVPGTEPEGYILGRLKRSI